jgi:ABC-type branched-subunit amino acid transport system ATPase component
MGAGKTTVFNLLTKFLPPTRSEIFYLGKPITRLKPNEIARLGLVRSFQISAVFDHVSVVDMPLSNAPSTHPNGPLGKWVHVILGMIFVICVLLFRVGIIGWMFKLSRRNF